MASLAAPVARSDRPLTSNAVALHRRISPDRWCVTFSDLKYLKREVRRAIATGEIKPPDDGTDNFLDADGHYGPSIYTVTEQHIKPVTDLAGKMSWALMRNPEGLDCDVFISHAWQEGIFEFLSKVMHSWPHEARQAWCCMLANPQHLDITGLLQSPQHSPFALALQASQAVLVVPNRHFSIYTRLWCCYEAYLAQEQGKVILIARASNRKEIWRAMEHMGLAALAGILLSWVLDFKGLTEYVNLGVICLVAATGVCSMGMAKNTVRAALNLTGGVLCWYLAFEWHTVRGLYTDSPSAFLRAVPAVAQRVWITVVASAFLLLEIDRIKSQATENEAAQLRRGYTGSIVDAACSRAEDEQRIREEIGDQIGAVDYAIEVLMSAGMSTPILREIASKGVSIQQAANPALALPMLMFGPFLAITAFMLVLDAVYLDSFWTWRLVPLRTLTCLERILMIILIRQSPRDERCFDYLVIQKCAVVYLAVFTPPMFQCEMIGKLSYQKDSMWFVIPPVAYTTMFIFVLLGFRRTANLPCGLGPCLVQLFLARDPCVQLAAAGHCIRRKNTAAESPQSSDSESESPCAD